MTRIMGALLVVMATVGACSNEEPVPMSSKPSSSTAGSSTTTTSPVAAPANCRESSESSPATFDDRTGVYATFITSFPDTSAPLTFDVVQWLSGEDARKEYERRTGDPNGPPNDYELLNESTATRSAPVAADAHVWLVRLADDGSADLDPGTVDQLPAYLALGHPTDVYWLTFSEGIIVEVCEQYRP